MDRLPFQLYPLRIAIDDIVGSATLQISDCYLDDASNGGLFLRV